MIGYKIKRWLAAGTFLTTAAFASVGATQTAPNPFLDNTLAMSQAFGLEMIGIRLAILEAMEPPVDDELIEVIETMAKTDFERFAGTLAAIDEDFAKDFHEVLEYFEDALEDGDDVRALIPTAREMLAQAYDMIIDPALRESDAFKGAVAAQLLLAEGGVSEGYEEAADEIWAFSMGWSSLQRVKAIWAELAGNETETRRDEATQLIGILDALYPTAMPPMPFVGRNPEEAEGPSQLLMGLLEEAAGANLYAGRDLGVLAGHLSELVGTGCAAFEAGNDDVGREYIWAAFDHYAGETTGLGNLVDLFGPDVNEDVMEAFGMLVVAEDDDDSPDEAADDEEESEMLPAAEACRIVEEGLDEARVVVGG